jgi:hypothetical protein
MALATSKSGFHLELDSFLYIFSDRINRINRIFSRFPDETMKFTSVCRRIVSD